MEKSLAKLLKEKNVLVSQINELKIRIKRENVIEGTNISKYNVKTEYEALNNTIEKLVAVKTLISQLNVKVVDKIYRLGELKSQVKYLKELDVREGMYNKESRYGESMVPVQYKPQIDSLFVDSEVERLVKQINEIQDELDTYNHDAKIAY